MKYFMKRIICILFASFSFGIIAVAQITGVNKAFSKVLEVTNEKTKKESFKGQILKGKRNGMGLLSMKDGYIYVGDFYRNNMSGYGMFIAPENENIRNCDSCTVYVGNILDGKKHGFGSCYSANGRLIYQGQFENDKPTSTYPALNINQLKNFSLLELTNGDIFLGEIKNGNANGYGVLLFPNGDLWLSTFKEGMKKGIGLYLLYDGEWETLNFNGNNFDVVSSSVNYRNIDTARKQSVRSSLSQALGYFAAAANTAVDLAENIHTIKQGGNSSSVNEGGRINESSSTIGESNSKNPKQARTNSDSDRDVKWMQGNYQTQKRIYGNYETQLINMKTYPEKYSDSQRRDIQTKMKKIRETIISHGGTCAQSQWETWKP